MISWHKVGQKVVCINAGRLIWTLDTQLGGAELVEGSVYTIKEVIAWPTIGVGFRLAEGFRYSGTGAHHSSRFEPVYPQALDRLRGLLTPTLEEKRPFLEEIIADRVAGLPV